MANWPSYNQEGELHLCFSTLAYVKKTLIGPAASGTVLLFAGHNSYGKPLTIAYVQTCSSVAGVLKQFLSIFAKAQDPGFTF